MLKKMLDTDVLLTKNVVEWIEKLMPISKQLKTHYTALEVCPNICYKCKKLFVQNKIFNFKIITFQCK